MKIKLKTLLIKIAGVVAFLAALSAIWSNWKMGEHSYQERAAKVQELLDKALYAIEGDGALQLNLDCDVTLDRERRFEKGFSILRQAQELAPEDPRVIGSFGSMYLAKCDWQKAEDYLRDCVRLDNNDAFCHQQLGKSLQRQGKSGYEEHYRKARELEPDNLNVALEIAGETENIDLYAELLREHPERMRLTFESAKKVIENKFGEGSMEQFQQQHEDNVGFLEELCETDDSELKAITSQLSRETSGIDPERDILRRELLKLIAIIRQQPDRIGCNKAPTAPRQ